MTEPRRLGPRSQQTPPRLPTAVTTSVWDHSRRYAIYHGNELLGTTNLEYPIAHGERAAGQFFPAWQFRNYESVFLLYAGARDEPTFRRYLRQLGQLALEIWDAGVRIDGRVELISPWNARKWMIHVSITDPRFWAGRLRS